MNENIIEESDLQACASTSYDKDIMVETEPEAVASTSSDKVKELFDELMMIRKALVGALTRSSDHLYERCKRVEGIACLRGFSDASWVLRVHWKTNAIPKAPKPTFGINFTDGMDKDEWLHLVAKHSDSWLLAEACFKASESQFQPAERVLLFSKMAQIPSIAERVQLYIEKAKQKNKRVLDATVSVSTPLSSMPPKKRRHF